MSKSTFIAAVALGATVALSLGCDEWMVGAPCTPETDKGVFQKDMSNTTYGVETRSVQCETSICVTKTNVLDVSKKPEGDTEQSDYEFYRDKQSKFSFCSCRCMDADGHKYDRNNDKYDDLCECPPNTKCLPILSKNIADAPEKIKGSYCIPNCIADGCSGFKNLANGTKVVEQCLPSSESDEPWQWKCRFPKN